jgi:signal transduction histidine kinase
LREANAELTAFAHTVAHDLRAPLRNVYGFASALLEDEAPRLSEDGKFYLQRMGNAAARMDQLITDLLEYSRLARAEIRLEPVAGDRVVSQVLADLGDEIARANADVQVAKPLPLMMAHRSTLVQVLVNLVGNALKFMPAGVLPRITISAARAGEWVEVVVADNGIGIAAEHQGRVFEVFERLHGQERYPGTGIGLAIVRKGVERMGGTVRLESRVGAGSRFIIRLHAPPGRS